MTWWRSLFPLGLSAQFTLLLFTVLVVTNLVAAFLMASEGTHFDRTVRIQRDMGRLTALVTTLEETDRDTGFAIMNGSTTGYTRFSIGDAPIGATHIPPLRDIEMEIQQALSGRDVRVVPANPVSATSNAPPLMLISVQLSAGVHKGLWLNSLVYPLPMTRAFWQKIAFFVPLAASLAGSLGVGLIFIHRMTKPLRQLANAARAAGRGDRLAHVAEIGARELREAAVAFNHMQRRILHFDVTRRQLLAAIGHDLRTPITGLRIRAELLEDEDLRAPMVRVLDEMKVMTDDLLRYARGISESEDPRDTDLSVLIAHLCAERGATFSAAAPMHLQLRPVAFTRAIGNLIDNAMRYAGGASVRVAQVAHDAVITVEDDGCGIPVAQLETVFEPFVRGDASRSPETGGTGLGLSIARTIITDLGGTLTLHNRPTGGLRATVRLPLSSYGPAPGFA